MRDSANNVTIRLVWGLPNRWVVLLISLMLTAIACNMPSVGGNPPTTTPVPPTVTSAIAPSVTPTDETAEPEPTSQEPPPDSACPEPTFLALPETPPPFAEYHTAINDYLSEGGPVNGLEPGLRNWGSITEHVGGVITDADLTGDGIPEVIVVVHAPREQFPDAVFVPGDLYIYGCESSAYTLLYADFSHPERPAPEILFAGDLNRTGSDNLVYTVSQTCGAHTCFIKFYALAYDAASGQVVNLLQIDDDDEGLPNARASVVDSDGDGVSEIVVDTGGIGSAGAGPQRTYRVTYVWDGAAYVPGESVQTSENWPIHFLQDADAAAEEGDYEEALAIYQQMLDDPDPPRFTGIEDEILMLQRYARYRVMLMHVLSGDDASALLTYQALYGEIEPGDTSPEAGFPILADLFWQEYSRSPNVANACRVVVDYAASHPETYSILNEFGYANRQYMAEDMCPYHIVP